MYLQFILAYLLLTNPADINQKAKKPSLGAQYCLVNAMLYTEKEDWQKVSRYLLRFDRIGEKNVRDLLPFLKSKNADFRSSVIDILGNMGDKGAVKPLVTALETEQSVDVKLTIIEALGKLKDRRAVKILEKELASELWGLRIAAATSLESITGKKYDYSTPPPRR